MAAFKLLTVLATLGVAYSQNPAAPALIWGNHRSIDKMTSNLGKISADNVEDLIMKPAVEDDPKTHVLIGMLDSLSLPDLFKKYGNEEVFANVKSMMGKSKYKNFILQTKGSLNNANPLYNASDVQNIVTSRDSQVHVIKITPKGEDITETLKMADNIMHKACDEHASQYKSYICVMTASSGGEEGDHVRIARSLLETAPAEEQDLSQDIFYVENFALVYTKMPIDFEIQKPTTTPNTPPTYDKYNLTKAASVTKKDDNTLSVRFPTEIGGTQITLMFNFESTGSSWSLENISYGNNVMIPKIHISTSAGYSFHTPSKVEFISKNNSEYKLIFNSLQVEFSSKLPTPRFSLADDTVYFFTIPILSGLFVTSLLVTIVLLGLSMIFDIKTMDLFDDPKGKTVTINAQE